MIVIIAGITNGIPVLQGYIISPPWFCFEIVNMLYRNPYPVPPKNRFGSLRPFDFVYAMPLPGNPSRSLSGVTPTPVLLLVSPLIHSSNMACELQLFWVAVTENPLRVSEQKRKCCMKVLECLLEPRGLRNCLEPRKGELQGILPTFSWCLSSRFFSGCEPAFCLASTWQTAIVIHIPKPTSPLFKRAAWWNWKFLVLSPNAWLPPILYWDCFW